MELLTRWGRDIKQEGRVLGREEGKEIGARELLLSIGEHRFGPPSKSVIARISKISDMKIWTS